MPVANMSVDLYVYFDPALMPSPSRWAQAARQLEFDVLLDSDFSPESFSGFMPCKYKGIDAGFEYYRGSVDAAARRRLNLSDQTLICYVAFATRSNYREYATSMICAAVLCLLTGGVLVDDDGRTVVSSSLAIQWAKDGEMDIQEDIKRQDEARSWAPTTFPSTLEATAKPWWRIW